jgi:hypothetical protein
MLAGSFKRLQRSCSRAFAAYMPAVNGIFLVNDAGDTVLKFYI